GRTVIRGGIGLFYDNIDLNVASFSQLQERIWTRFGADGQSIIGLPERQHFEFTDPRFRTPRSVNWNVELDREWLKNLMVRVGYQQRQASREFVLNPIDSEPGAVAPGFAQYNNTVLGLSNAGSSRYREFQVTARYQFREHDEFFASYV